MGLCRSLCLSIEKRPATVGTAPRTVAVTIDDLPTVGARSLGDMQDLTAKILHQLQTHRIPAIGFVNEQKLGAEAPMPERVFLFEQWLNAGFELGNHTFSHPSLYNTPLDEFKQDVLRGEVVSARLMEQHGKRLRYFRHPFLNTGPSIEIKAAFESFLAENGYAVAPVTIDNDDYVYALAYIKAEAVGDNALMARIGEDYVQYMERIFDFFEELSRDVVGREPAQILLLHANSLNADYLDELAEMMKRRGYRFVSLDQALQDQAYRATEDYVGRSGVSWLQRWLVTRGKELRKEPQASAWVQEIAYPNRK